MNYGRERNSAMAQPADYAKGYLDQKIMWRPGNEVKLRHKRVIGGDV